MLASFFTFHPAFIAADMSSSAEAFVEPEKGQQPDVNAHKSAAAHHHKPLPATGAQPAEQIFTLAAETKEAHGTEPPEGKDITEEAEEESPKIPDPLAPLNKIMFDINDKLYFWALKPAAQAYSHIIPEGFRIMFSNVYDNLWAPSRVINNLLQFRLKASGNELIRFIFNSFAGIGGLGDAAADSLGIKKQEADFGQTLGHYGVDHGFYLVLPVFGPSSLRDGVGLTGDFFLHPLAYLGRSHLTLLQRVEIFTHWKVNDTTFKIGDYESFKESAIDPYISMRDAFVQHRKKDVEESKK